MVGFGIPNRISSDSFLIKIERFIKLLRLKTSMRDVTKIPAVYLLF